MGIAGIPLSMMTKNPKTLREGKNKELFSGIFRIALVIFALCIRGISIVPPVIALVQNVSLSHRGGRHRRDNFRRMLY